MCQGIRCAGIALFAVFAAVVLVVSTTTASVAHAATALIVGGGGDSLGVPSQTPSFISRYVDFANNYIAPSGWCGDTSCTLLTIYKPEGSSWDEAVAGGQANLDSCIRGNTNCIVTGPPYTATGQQTLSDTSYVVWGASQGSTVATVQKQYLAANPVPGKTVNFIFVANPNRPHGGVMESYAGTDNLKNVLASFQLIVALARFDFNALAEIPKTLSDGLTNSGATSTDTNMPSVDVARQYDPVADFPTNPSNSLAYLTAMFGFAYLHCCGYSDGTPLLQGQFGDTTYYLIPSPVLPLLMPLQQMPILGPLLVEGLDPVLRVLVERAYDRTINPGQPTPANTSYSPDPVQTVKNLAIAIPTGMDNMISYITKDPANRPLGTAIPISPYGVGGPPVDTGCGTPPCGPPTPLSVSPTASAPTTGPTVTPATSIPLAPAPPDQGVTTAFDRSAASMRTVPLATTVDSPRSISSGAEGQDPAEARPTPTTRTTKTPSPTIRKLIEPRVPLGPSNSSSTVGSPRTGDSASERSTSATGSSTGNSGS